MMTKEQRDYLRYLRLSLGDAMREARERMAPIELTLEQGYRWEEEETLVAILAGSDLEARATDIGQGLGQFVERYGGGFGKAEISRSREARRYIAEAVKLLRSIDANDIIELEKRWLEGTGPVEKGHEVYFEQRFTAAMRVLRLAWTTLFYATQKAVLRRIEMTARQSSQYHDPKSGIAAAVQSQASELATASGKHVEVYDAEGDLVFVAVPGDEPAPPVPGRKAAAGGHALAGLRPDQAEEIREIIKARPGISLRDAAAAVGAELEPVASAHPNRRDHEADRAQLRELWSWLY